MIRELKSRSAAARFWLRWLACLFVITPWVLPAAGQNYPNKPVQIVVPVGPGGIPDLLARMLAEKLTKYTGQSCIVENRPGASGNIGGEVIARAEPDGHHLLMTPGHVLTINKLLYAQMSFDPTTAFAAVSLVADMPTLLVVSSELKTKSLDEFLALAKKHPDGLFFSSPGPGTSLHVAMELFQQTTGVKLHHVAYKSGAEAVSAAVSGQVAGLFANLPLVLSQVRSGKLRAIGVAASTRLPQLSDVPTFSEAGLPGFVLSSWFGLVAPAKTPAATLNEVSQLVAKALQEPDVQKRFGELGARLVGNKPAEFEQFIRSERVKTEEIFRVVQIKIN